MKHEKIEVGNESVGGLLQWEGGVLVGGSLKLGLGFLIRKLFFEVGF